MHSAAAISATTDVSADDRRFTYTYEATTSPKGSWEFEQWLTWKGYHDGDTFDFRHELEYGITDNLQIGLYLSDWSLSVPDHDRSRLSQVLDSSVRARTDENRIHFLFGHLIAGFQPHVPLRPGFSLIGGLGNDPINVDGHCWGRTPTDLRHQRTSIQSLVAVVGRAIIGLQIDRMLLECL